MKRKVLALTLFLLSINIHASSLELANQMYSIGFSFGFDMQRIDGGESSSNLDRLDAKCAKLAKKNSYIFNTQKKLDLAFSHCVDGSRAGFEFGEKKSRYYDDDDDDNRFDDCRGRDGFRDSYRDRRY
jgi:hypothetical protein